MSAVTIKPLRRALLTLDGQEPIEVERLGQGRYTTAWVNSHWVYLQTHEKDQSKAIMEAAGSIRHVPQVEYLGFMNPCWNVYKEPKYKKLTAASKEAWQDFRMLEQTLADAARSLYRYGPKPSAAEVNARFVETLPVTCSQALREAVEALVNEAINYGEYRFEIRRGNLAVGYEGELILLDPLFDQAEVEAYWEKRRMKSY